MDMFLIAVMASVSGYLSVTQIIRNLYGPEPHEENAKWLPLVTTVALLCLMCNLLVRDMLAERTVLVVSMTLISVCPLSCSVIPDRWSRLVAIVASSVMIVSVSVVSICVHKFSQSELSVILTYMSLASCCVPAVFFIFGIYRRIRDIKVVMRAGSVWTMVCLSVDAVYISILLLYAVLLPEMNLWVSGILLFSVLVAQCLRIRNHSAFVFLVNHERRIVESMRLSQAECIGDNPGTDLLYDNIYERVLRYFEVSKPYLDNTLTISDIADIIFTNKVYISRAINHCTGRNFCQFVNYHRVSHAVELFRGNPQLKVVEIANRSGFNSSTSFNNAFRLYMGEKPGEWCRKERARLNKK